MRSLQYSINIEQLRSIKQDIVPVLFTEHQFKLIEKKSLGKPLNASQKSEFSRSISRKMNAIHRILEKDTDNIFIYGKERMKKNRVPKAIKYIKKFERTFKNKHIIITGSYLYSDFKDIDIFVISKFEKEDYKSGRFHITYLNDQMYYSLFYRSIRSLCISNRPMDYYELKETITNDTFISLYQELFHDITEKSSSIKITARKFLLQAAFISQSPIPDSFELTQKVNRIVQSKKPKLIIKTIFVGSINQNVVKDMKIMIHKYNELAKEYKQHKEYYDEIVQAFKEVIAIES